MTQIFNNKEIKGFCLSLTKSHDEGNELFSNLLEIVAKKPKIFTEAEKKGYLIPYCCRIIYNEFRNQKSKFNQFAKNQDGQFYEKTQNGNDLVIPALLRLNNISESVDDYIHKKDWQIDEIEKRIALDKTKKKTMYQATLFDLWRNEYRYSQKELSEKSGIARRSVNYALNEYKDKLKNLKKIIVLNKPYGSKGVQYHRIAKPYQKLSEYSDKLNIEIVSEYKGEPCHYLVFNRTCAQQVIGHYENIINAKAQGTKVVLDLDDYWNLPVNHTLHGMYRDLNIPAMTEKTIKMVDIITTSNKILAEKIKAINPNIKIHIIRNVIDLEEKQWQTKSKINDKSPVFGWVCSGAHTSDLAEVSLLAQKQFAGEHRKTRTHLAGFSNRASAMVTIAEAMTFNGKLKRDNITLSPFVPVTQYANNYNDIDVAIAPLQNNEFNSCKSELKVLEAGAKGLPIIVSDVYPYNTFSEDLIYISKSPAHFCDIVKHIQNNMDEAKAKAERLHCHIKENWTYKNETPCLEKVFI